MVVEKTDDGREQIRMDGVTIRQSPFQDELFVDSACYLRKQKIKQLILHLQAWVDTGSLERMQWQPMKTAPTEKWGRVIGWCVYPIGAEPRIVQLNHLGDWMYNECKQNVTAWMPLPSEPLKESQPMNSESSVKLIEDWRERWEPVNKGKYSVVAVYETGDGIEAVVNEPGHGLLITTESDLVPIPQPKKLRPWKREEVPVGSVVRDRDGNAISVIGCIDNSIAFINVTGVGWRTPDRLLSDFVLHMTSPDGTWIPTEQCPKCGVEE